MARFEYLLNYCDMKPKDIARLTEISVKMMRGALPFFLISAVVYAITASHGGGAMALLISKWCMVVFGVMCLPMVVLMLIFGVGLFLEK